MSTVKMNYKFKEFANKKITELQGVQVRSGFIGSNEVAKIARIQNSGAIITVTPKMRKYLGMRYGVWLSKNTTAIRIPPRPFMNVAYDRNKKYYGKVLDNGLRDTGKLWKALEQLGNFIKGNIKDSISGYFGAWQDNAWMTIKLKGRNTPLIGKTKGMKDSVDYIVEEK